MEISVSMVAAPCRRLVKAARWNGRAAHATTGVVRASATHCQPANCSDGTMARAATGSDSATAAASRARSGRSGSVAEAAPASSGAGWRGSVAVYPAASTWATSSWGSIPSGKATRAFSVA